MDTHEKLGEALFSSLIKLREQKNVLNMTDVGALFEQMSETFRNADGAIDRGLKEEIEQLAVFITQAKNEIYDIGVAGNGTNATGDAAMHLDAVIKGTEEASHAIMDAADVIQAAANAIGGEQQQVITDAVMRIYEACNFQDLTGQRVSKVIKILGEIDTRIHNMLKLFGAAAAQTERHMPKNIGTDDSQLLNGPQLPDQAPSQDDIDALFANGAP